jgi:hypothetical protein
MDDQRQRDIAPSGAPPHYRIEAHARALARD